MHFATHFKSPPAVLIHGAGPHAWDRVIVESANFVVIPSLGALVEGWVLVVPKHSRICLGAIPQGLWPELIGLVDAVGGQLKAKYGPVALFEHGPAAQDTLVGCGVDHAHLHLVPTEIPLLAGAQELAPRVTWRPETSLRATCSYRRAGQAYLYLEQPLGSAPFVGTGAVIPSQLFRRVIARYLGKPEKYDWKSNPNLETIEATLTTLLPERGGQAVGGLR